jgi:hypothetical protein
MLRRWVLAALVVVLVVAAAVVVLVRALSGPSSRLAGALELAPRSAVRFSWTDWSGVRDGLGVSSSVPVDELMRKAYDDDLSSASALVDSAPVLARSFDLSPANLDWELYAQGTDGAVLLLGLPDGVSGDDVRATLAGVGYTDPQSDDGVWQHPDLHRIGELTPELTAVTVDDHDHVLAASDSADFLRRWRDDRRGSDDDAVAQVVDAVGDVRSASVYDGDYACRSLAMSQADGAEQAETAQLIRRAGKINPLDAFAIAREPGRDVRVAMAFETADQARTNADTRSRLAVGPAPGQGGTFGDRFDLGRVAAQGDVVTMELHAKPDTFVLSDLATGPLLFASC